MNTLNNQQINPGNRVDFSRIRRFSKGGVPKYQNTPGPLEYDWDPFYGQFSNNPLATMNSKTSLPWNRSWAPNATYNTVQDLENSQNYKDFTNYVLNNSTNEQVMQYLKHLDTQARRSGTNEGVLFTDASQTPLRDGWNNEYTRLRNDGKYGYFHLNPDFKPATIPPPTEDITGGDDEGEIQGSSGTPYVGSYEEAEYLPEYKKGLYTDWAHLGAIYANNMRGLRKQRDLGMQQKVSLDQAPQYNSVVTDGYTERKANEAAKNDMLARASAVAGNTSSAEAQRQIMEQANEAGLQADLRNNQIQASEFNKTTAEAANIANTNNQLRQTTANANRQKLAADWNSKLNTQATYEANKTAQTSDFINKLDHSYSTYQQQEKANALAHNQAINEYMFGVERDRAWKDVQDWQNSGFRTMDYGGGRTYDGLINYITSGGDEELLSKMSDADLQTLQENAGDASIVMPVLERYAQDSDEIRSFLAAYKSKLSTLEDDYYTRAQDLMSHYKKLGLYQKQYYGSDPGWKRDGLNVNWSTMPYYKSGGKVYDRVLKYIEHNRTVANDRDKRAANAEKEAQKKLLRDLDSLDRETMLLLRAIFK